MRQDKNGMSLPWYPISRISSRPAGTIMGHVRSKKNWRKRGADIQTQDREDHEAEESGIGLHNRTVQTTKRS